MEVPQGSAIGGTVIFEPAVAIFDPKAPAPVSFAVTLEASPGFPFPGFTAVDIVFGSQSVPLYGFRPQPSLAVHHATSGGGI